MQTSVCVVKESDCMIYAVSDFEETFEVIYEENVEEICVEKHFESLSCVVKETSFSLEKETTFEEREIDLFCHFHHVRYHSCLRFWCCCKKVVVFCRRVCEVFSNGSSVKVNIIDVCLETLIINTLLQQMELT